MSSYLGDRGNQSSKVVIETGER